MDKKTIMIVDDDGPTNKGICDTLENEGYDMISVFSGEEALESLKENRVDLIIIDYYMSTMSGIDLYMKILGTPELKKSRVIFLTVANFSEELIEDLKDRGAKDYLQKPFDTSVLLKKIAKALE